MFPSIRRHSDSRESTFTEASRKADSGVFLFSSRRRHTSWTGDWSSDVCSYDLARRSLPRPGPAPRRVAPLVRDRRAGSEERRVGKSVDLGGRRIIKKKKRNE